jgi:aminoglycoside phosphotransferase (APT) family kinase protein
MTRLVQRLAPGGRLLWTRRLRGGLGSAMNVMRIEAMPGKRSSVVLRRYVPGWRKSTPERARFEFDVLGLVESAGIPAPRRLLLDAEGYYFGTPAMVLSYLPGRSFFAPPDISRWTDELARGLALVHAVRPERYDLSWLPGDPVQDMRAELDERLGQLPEMEPLALEAFAALQAQAYRVDGAQSCLVHDDYWPGNTVWYRGRLTGIIDWTDARLGDPRADLAQCRADLVLSHGLGPADDFLQAYRRRSSVALPDMTFFDLLRGLRALIYYKQWLKGYHDAGLTHLNWNGVEERLQDFVRRSLANL